MKRSVFPEEGIWLKGNIHSHSTVSDGQIAPLDLARLYYEHGYDFLSMTDHNVIVDHNELPPEKLLLLTGVEHDIGHGPDKCLHVVGTTMADRNMASYVCRRYTELELTDQQMLDMMYADGQFITLAHPIWSRMEPEEVLALEHFHAIEVYNNGTERLGHCGYAEAYWDMLLRRGKRVFAVATDDVHGYDDLFGGWICVKAKERSLEAVLYAIRNGDFFASNGPTIFDYAIDDSTIFLSCTPCREIHFVTYPPRGSSFYAKEESLLEEASCELSGRETYVRAVCVDEDGHYAWTNPIYLDITRKEQ